VDDDERKRRIIKLNFLYLHGNEIHVWIQDEEVFLHQIVKKLEIWNCKFNYVKRGKPDYDILIDDKTDNCNHFFNSLKIEGYE